MLVTYLCFRKMKQNRLKIMYLITNFLKGLPKTLPQNRVTNTLHFDGTYLTTRKERYLYALNTKARLMRRHVTSSVAHPLLLEWVQYGASLHVQSQSVRTTLGKVVNMNIIFISCNWVVTRWQWLFYI